MSYAENAALAYSGDVLVEEGEGVVALMGSFFLMELEVFAGWADGRVLERVWHPIGTECYWIRARRDRRPEMEGIFGRRFAV